jgi:hypothetical protein
MAGKNGSMASWFRETLPLIYIVIYIDNQINYVYARFILAGNAHNVVDVEAVKHFLLQRQYTLRYSARQYQFEGRVVG